MMHNSNSVETETKQIEKSEGMKITKTTVLFTDKYNCSFTTWKEKKVSVKERILNEEKVQLK